MEHRLSPAFELKRRSVAPSGEFEGYASTFNGPVDSYGHVIAPGAFSESLAMHKAQGTTPALLWSHDPREPIGKWISVVEDPYGLKVAGKLTLDVARARDAHALLKDDALGLSIGYVEIDSEYDSRRGTALLKKLMLFEVSVVAMPANPAARVTGVKSITSIRDLEDALRTLGFSGREAKRLAAGGWGALRRDDSDEVRDVAELLKQSAAQINSLNLE